MAEDEIKRSDASNASRMHEQFGVEWGDPALFDMVLNMDRLTVDTAVQQIKSNFALREIKSTVAIPVSDD